MKIIESDNLGVFYFDSIESLNQQLYDEVKQGDTVLIKGSRALKMEQIVEFLYDGLS